MTQTCEAINDQRRIWVFRAGLFLDTPLRELLQHGATAPGAPGLAPAIADAGRSRGSWRHVPARWQETEDIDIDPITLESVDSDIGPVPADGADYLPFLIKFRRIIESGLPHDELAGVLEQMFAANSSYRKFFEKHGSIADMLRRAGVTYRGPGDGLT